MHWIIDARTAIAGLHGGVSRVSTSLCDAIVKTTSDSEITCVTTGRKKPERGTAALQTKHLHIPYPNKLWSSGSFFRTSSLTKSVERRVGSCDAAFFPNIGFTGHITVPYALLLHDISFLIEPMWFSRRMRLWHRAVRARQMITNADHLFAVSETTKIDAINLLKIPSKNITVLPIGLTLQGNPSVSPLGKGRIKTISPLTKGNTRGSP